MNQVVVEGAPSERFIKFLRNASILEAALGALSFLFSPSAAFFIFFLIFPVTFLFWYYFYSMSPLRVEFSSGDGGFLIVSKKCKEVWRARIENIESVGFQGGRIALLIIYLKGDNSISFPVNNMRLDQIEQIRSWIRK